MSGIHSIPLSLPFVDVLAAGLLARAGTDMLTLPRTTVLLPTARACRSLREAFLRLGDGPLLLPRMQALGDLDADELTLRGVDIAPAVSPLRRQALLAQALLKSGYSRSPAEAASVALALGRFIDEIETEEIGHEAVQGIVPDAYALHWQKILKFLTVVQEIWPTLLANEGRIDAAARRRQIYDSLAMEWTRSPPTGPVIIAGSNGSVKALRRLMKLVAGLRQGEVILHGLDRDMDEASWLGMECSHPQRLFAVILRELGRERRDVPDWVGGMRCEANATSLAAREKAPGPQGWEGKEGSPLTPTLFPNGVELKSQPFISNEPRERLISIALIPAEASAAWHRLAKGAVGADALRGVARADCATVREEAETIALLFRHALETPGKRAALVTPDRELARLVAASLERWNITVDDSAGTRLAATPPAGFLRLIAAMASEDIAPYPLLACLKHPLAQGGLPAGEFRFRVRLLERRILRGPAPGLGFPGLIASVAQAGMAEEERAILLPWLRDLQSWAEPFLMTLDGESAPSRILRAHVEFAEALATGANGRRGEALWRGAAGESLAEFISDALAALEGFPSITDGYPALFDAFIGTQVVRTPIGLHPRLFIWGTIEARLQQADLVILGGLNEDTWPEPSPADPFLSRPMRAALGMPPPEFRVGISAHDFATGLAGPEVVLTRSQRVKGVPTVPSRWLLRLDAVLHAAGLALPSATGAGEIMRLLDQAAATMPATQPSPRPPLGARPRRFSVSDVEAWLNDPYRFYARRVLGLKPLDSIAAEPGAAERGTLIHAILERFARRFPRELHAGALPDEALSELLALGREVFGVQALAPAVEAFWWPRFERIASWIVDTEQERRGRGVFPAVLEVTARHTMDAPGGPFTLVAKADRIDRHVDGSLEVIDYKTGGTPAEKDVLSGVSPQLSLEAALATLGAFAGVTAAPVRGAAYWKLSGGTVLCEIKEFAALPEDILERLAARVAQFDDPAMPYLAVAPSASQARLGYHAEYQHLERLAEWSGGSGEGDE